MSGPCSGLAVLDLTRSVAGALTTMMLADNGADVLMIEPPEGHPLRAEPGFLAWGRGKRSLAFDLDSAGAERVRGLAADADVLIESFGSGEAERLGLDWPDLHARNPRLVLCSLPSFGAGTVEDTLPPDDALVAARAGIMGTQPGFREGPVFVRPMMSSHGAAMLTIQALGAALYAREHDGAGRLVRVPLWHGALAMQSSSLMEVERGSFPIARRTATDGRPLYRLYQCQDGRWIHLGVLTPRFWPGVALAAGHPEWVSDPRYSTMPNLPTAAEREAFIEMLAAIIDQKPFAEWERLFEEYDVPCAPAQTVDEFLHDARLDAAKLLVEIDDPRAGSMRQMGLPVAFQRTPGQVRVPAPTLGEGGEHPLHPSPPVRDLTPGPFTSGEGGIMGASLSLAGESQGEGEAREPARPQAAPATPSTGAVDTSTTNLARPLAGVRIVDLSSFIAGPLGASFLADLGADVIKVEAPDGDGLRGNRGFLAWSRGRRGLGLDLKQPEAREILYRLVDQADVVLENMRPGVTERLSIDYETLRARNPRLIYCSVTAFGPSGPYRSKPGFDPLLQARSGIERAQGGRQNPPVFLLVPVTDNTCAMLNAVGIALALYERERSGQGQRVETSLLRAACFVQSDSLLEYEGRPPRPANDPGQFGPDAFYRLYRCADGWLLLAARTDAQRQALTDTLGVTYDGEAIRMPRITPSAAELDLAEALAARFSAEPVDVWLERLRVAGVPAVRAEENYSLRFVDDPMLAGAGLVVTYDHPEFGHVRQPAGLASFGVAPQPATRPAPLIGQHTSEILAELGYDVAQIASLLERGAAVETNRALPS
jgi:crotonobetainyl-CoA:carnitine CoA-transferase CaiB-like acyl-CoA transferase